MNFLHTYVLNWQIYNQFHDNKSLEVRFREVNNRLILEGPLRVFWGVQGVIHLKEDDDQRTFVVRKRNSCRASKAADVCINNQIQGISFVTMHYRRAVRIRRMRAVNHWLRLPQLPAKWIPSRQTYHYRRAWLSTPVVSTRYPSCQQLPRMPLWTLQRAVGRYWMVSRMATLKTMKQQTRTRLARSLAAAQKSPQPALVVCPAHCLPNWIIWKNSTGMTLMTCCKWNVGIVKRIRYMKRCQQSCHRLHRNRLARVRLANRAPTAALRQQRIIIPITRVLRPRQRQTQQQAAARITLWPPQVPWLPIQIHKIQAQWAQVIRHLRITRHLMMPLWSPWILKILSAVCIRIM